MIENSEKRVREDKNFEVKDKGQVKIHVIEISNNITLLVAHHVIRYESAVTC